MSPSATQNACGCEIVPRLPRETKVDVTKCHACHAQCRGVTRDQGAPKPDPSVPRSAMSATPATWNEGGCKVVPRLPCKSRGVGLCHACHAKRRWMRNEGGCEIVCVCVKLLYVRDDMWQSCVCVSVCEVIVWECVKLLCKCVCVVIVC